MKAMKAILFHGMNKHTAEDILAKIVYNYS